MGDIQRCIANVSGCPSDGRFQYNTQVAFSEEGELLAKYHKSHLFGEVQFDQPPTPDVVYFDTSFGVRFGMLICFDILFEEPQKQLYQLGVTDLVFSTWWINYPPMLTATQVQQAISYQAQINLLAAGSGTSWFNSGSGIYSEGNVLATFYNYNFTSQDKLLAATVATKQSPTASKATIETATKSTNAAETPLYDIYPSLLISADVNNFLGVSVKTFAAVSGSSGTLSVSSANLTCVLNYEISNISNTESSETYGLLASTPPMTVSWMKPADRVCTLLKCLNATTCGDFALETNTIFARFHLEGNFDADAELLYMASSNNDELLIDAQGRNQFVVDSSPNGMNSISSTSNFEMKLLSATLYSLPW